MMKRKRYLPVITKPERLHALENQIHRLHRRIDALNQRSNRLSWVRLAIFLPGFFLAILVFFLAGWPWSSPSPLSHLPVLASPRTFNARLSAALPGTISGCRSNQHTWPAFDWTGATFHPLSQTHHRWTTLLKRISTSPESAHCTSLSPRPSHSRADSASASGC